MLKETVQKIIGKTDAMEHLQALVNDLAGKCQARESKINENIKGLNREVQDLKVDIFSKTQQLVDAEIAGDTDAQAKLNKELPKLQEALSAAERKSEVYGLTLEAPALSTVEIEKLKAAALAARQDREQKGTALETKIDEAYTKIQALNLEISKLRDEKSDLRAPREAIVAGPVMGFIHPEFRDPKYKTLQGDYQYEFECWLNGQSIG